MENTPESKRIEIDEISLKDLDKTRKWSMFLAILGFIAIGIMIIIGIVAGFFLVAFKTQESSLGAAESVIIFIFLVAFAAIYFFPVMYLYLFSKHAGDAVRTLDKGLLEKTFKYLRKYYVYMGILAIIIIALYIIVLIASGASLSFLKDMGTSL